MYASGASVASIARMLGVSKDSASRHRRSGHVATLPLAMAPTTALPSGLPVTAEALIRGVIVGLDIDLATVSVNQRLAILEGRRRAAEVLSRITGPTPSPTIHVEDVAGLQEFIYLMARHLEPYPSVRFALFADMKKLGLFEEKEGMAE
jgi:hypothetical protein